jgi:hypothetical protein
VTWKSRTASRRIVVVAHHALLRLLVDCDCPVRVVCAY